MKKKLIAFIKLICILYLITILPQIISQRNKNHKEILNKNDTKTFFKSENLTKNNKKFSLLKKLEMGIVCNNASQKNVDLLPKKGFHIKKLASNKQHSGISKKIQASIIKRYKPTSTLKQINKKYQKTSQRKKLKFLIGKENSNSIFKK